MDWEQVVVYLIEAICATIVSVAIPYLANLLKQKVKNDKLVKWIEIAEGIVNKAVLTVKQTYVDGLKKDGKFGADEAKEAFESAKTQILAQLNETAKSAIIEAYGDIDDWIRSQIEANVSETK